MFAFCTASEIDPSALNTSNVTNMYNMFKYCVDEKSNKHGDKTMITARCIDKSIVNKIKTYKLIDTQGNIIEITSSNLKEAIKNKQIDVINLKLTTDNRLISIKRKKQTSEKIGGSEKIERVREN